jgi:hypothetical protein
MRDSNPRLSQCKRDTLATELIALVYPLYHKTGGPRGNQTPLFSCEENVQAHHTPQPILI